MNEISKLIHCKKPGCNDTGGYPGHVCGGDDDMCYRNCPEHIQCEFCWTDPDSYFNYMKLKDV